MQYYKRLLPSQLVRLREGTEIIVVLPPLPKKATLLEAQDYKAITKDINAVILDSCQGLQGEERQKHLDSILRSHAISREGGLS